MKQGTIQIQTRNATQEILPTDNLCLPYSLAKYVFRKTILLYFQRRSSQSAINIGDSIQRF
jgi:hypothetical protein